MKQKILVKCARDDGRSKDWQAKGKHLTLPLYDQISASMKSRKVKPLSIIKTWLIS